MRTLSKKKRKINDGITKEWKERHKIIWNTKKIKREGFTGFLTSVFFINHLSPSPDDPNSTISNILQKFSQIVATPGVSSLSTILVVNGENVKYRSLFHILFGHQFTLIDF
jgi:hypothetical protein